MANTKLPPNSKKRLWLPVAVLFGTVAAAVFVSFPDRAQDTGAATHTSDGQNEVSTPAGHEPAPLAEAARAALQASNTTDTDLLDIGEQVFAAGRIGLAEDCYRRALRISDRNTRTRLLLGNLLYATGRVYEARECWTPLLKSGGLDLLSLPLFGAADLKHGEDVAAIKQALTLSDTRQAAYANAHLLLSSRDLESARRILEPVFESSDWDDNFRMLWTKYLFLTGQTETLIGWMQDSRAQPDTPPPEFYLIQGRVCRTKNASAEAIACCVKAFTMDPNNYSACAQLAELLEVDGQPDSAQWFRQRAGKIRQYAKLCRSIHRSDSLPDQRTLEAVVQICRSLNVLREAIAWCTIAQAIQPDSDWMIAPAQECKAAISDADGRFSDDAELLSWRHKFSYRTPDWAALTTQAAEATYSRHKIQFTDVAESIGVDFIYENGRGAVDERRFFEFTGGGVAALDFDGDAWPDLFFSQGGNAPDLGTGARRSTPPPNGMADRLYRNRHGIKAVSIEQVAGLVDGGYSQGCSSGDVNGDGFPDLYIANIGANQLFLNNGDGTFTSATLPGEPKWTTSCAIADLTGDGFADIYDVNHVQAQGVHATMCFRGDAAFPCDISRMKPEQDTLWENAGDGSFRDITQTTGIVAPEGIGLGICIADFDNSGTLSAFIANDARPNFFFVRDRETNMFRNVAAERGLAVKADGKQQACMGIAAGDVSGNGLIDLFVTNFFADYNTLYRQHTRSYFTDATADANLVAPSHHRLGFGSQFLDADLDGDLDIVLTNGDVEDFSKTNPNRPWEQQPQIFENIEGRFYEIDPEAAGQFFCQSALGRGLARLDWNRDGMPDFAVSHISSTAAVVINTSITENTALTIRLVGTRSPRDAIGAGLTGTGDLQTQYRQLTAGGGYHAGNERSLTIAQARDATTLRFTVVWPAGSKMAGTLASGPEWKLVEEIGRFVVPK